MAIDEPVRDAGRPAVLLRRGRILGGVTLGWNVAGIAVAAARSVALAGFGLDSLIEIGASTVVLWELSGSGEDRQRRALRLIGGAFLALTAYLTASRSFVLVNRVPAGAQRARDHLDGRDRRGDVRAGRGQGPDREGARQPGAGHGKDASPWWTASWRWPCWPDWC